VVLPHYQLDDLEALLAWNHPKAVRDDAAFSKFAGLSKQYFEASPADFGGIDVDLPGEGTFSGKVLRACRDIPFGQTMSYSGLAKQIGREDAARAVATALSKNPTPLVIPCHRVTYASGKAGGFSADGGPVLKQRMLDLEQRASG
jgi:methylated-DNA-[protein]-cysteine S-methyltransferase